jgi:hypothetical protein
MTLPLAPLTSVPPPLFPAPPKTIPAQGMMFNEMRSKTKCMMHSLFLVHTLSL